LTAIETNRHLDVSVSVAILLRAQGFEQANTQLLDADTSRQMNQLQGANTDTTLCPILTVHRVERGSDHTPKILSPTGHKLLQHLEFTVLEFRLKRGITYCVCVFLFSLSSY
jgi:hypothetical protein